MPHILPRYVWGWEGWILYTVPRGFISGLLLINVFLYDVFVIMNETDIESYVNDNVPNAAAKYLKDVIKSLEKDSDELFKWIYDNQIKVMNG